MEFGNANCSRYVQPKAMLKTLRYLQNNSLENQGLNNLSEVFQSFMTRAKFFGACKLRKTWSHSAVEFLKYRRLLPMLVSNDCTETLDNFDFFEQTSFVAQGGKTKDKKIVVSNVSIRATISQVQSFFTKFGPIQSCHFSTTDRRQTIYGTMSKQSKKNYVVTITFKKEDSAFRAKYAAPDELVFYGQQMIVNSYVSNTRKRTSSTHNSKNTNVYDVETFSGFKIDDEAKMSRSSSILSVSSNGTFSSVGTVSSCPLLLDELPSKVLERIFYFLNPIDRIRLECVNKHWLEIAAKVWANCDTLCFREQYFNNLTNSKIFNEKNPLKNSHLKAFLRRCGPHLRVLDLSNIKNVLDDIGVEEIGQNCPNLKELNISGIYLKQNTLCSLSEMLQNLKIIAYCGMHYVDDKYFWNLFKSNAKSIRVINLKDCDKIQGRFFKLFGPNLEEVYLDNCKNIDDEVIEILSSNSNSLKILSLNGCNKISDESLSLITRNLTDLTKFSLNGDMFSKISSFGLIQLSRLSLLTSVSFDYNSHVCDELLELLVLRIPKLKFLSLAFSGSDLTISSTSLLKLAFLKELIEVDVSGIAAVNDEFLISLCNNCKKLKNFVSRNCIYIGDNGVEAFTLLLTTINLIDLSGCILVTSKSIQTLIRKLQIDENTKSLPIVKLIIGGTLCEKNQLRLPLKNRVNLDYNDYSVFNLEIVKSLSVDRNKDKNNEELDNEKDLNTFDDEFNLLATHRSFIADAFNTEDESLIIENDKSILEWAEREAKELGLIDNK